MSGRDKIILFPKIGEKYLVDYQQHLANLGKRGFTIEYNRKKDRKYLVEIQKRGKDK